MQKIIKEYGLYAVLIIAVAGMLGSLYFGEVMGLAPCLLCWYQRIALYPIVAIMLVGIISKDAKAALYALPFSIIGFVIAAYHVLLTWGIIPEKVMPCSAGVSCAEITWSLFNFITIPFLSLVAFVAMTIILFVYKNYAQRI